MLAVSPLRSTKDESQGEMESFSVDDDDFADLSDRNLLESINFDDLFLDINLPDLEMDSEIFAELSAGGGGEESEMTWLENKVDNNPTTKKEEDDKVSSINSGTGLGSGSGSNAGSSRGDQEIVSKRDESVVVNPSPKEVEKGRKSSSAQSQNNSQGKRKVKVDWTPELHKRFVQAVEKLGVDKAVPSRILEIMGIDCLTRHNIASHLQKYRSHRKNLLAREVEAASWSQRCQIYGVATAGGGGGCGGKRDISPWLAPTMGFPPMTPIHHFRGLHVWGHPSMDQPFMHMYPPSPPPPAWAPPVAPPPHPPTALDPSYWHSFHQRGQNALTPAIPYFAQPLTTTKFASPLVPGIPPPPHAMYRVDAGGIGLPTGQSGPRTLLDLHPSKESIDAAIGDALSKPWLPLPLGLRAPALDSVMGEFQRQGISKIPPSSAKP